MWRVGAFLGLRSHISRILAEYKHNGAYSEIFSRNMRAAAISPNSGYSPSSCLLRIAVTHVPGTFFVAAFHEMNA